mmetsp:Transcript_77161/g.226330  ORF Transcript_77161/g.226330 Transcript_77161/m.226330 type:complete len:386 (+) Transcript_77161:1441-2598(+)
MSWTCSDLSIGFRVRGSPSKVYRWVQLTDLRASLTSLGHRQPFSSTIAITKPVGGVPRCFAESGSAVLNHRQSHSAGGDQPSRRCMATSFQRQASATNSPLCGGVGSGGPRSAASRRSRTCRILHCLHSSSSCAELPRMPLTSMMRSPLLTWRRGLATFQSLNSPPSTASMRRVAPSPGFTWAPRFVPVVLSSVMQYSFLDEDLPCSTDQPPRMPGLMMGSADFLSPFSPSSQSRAYSGSAAPAPSSSAAVAASPSRAPWTSARRYASSSQRPSRSGIVSARGACLGTLAPAGGSRSSTSAWDTLRRSACRSAPRYAAAEAGGQLCVLRYTYSSSLTALPRKTTARRSAGSDAEASAHPTRRLARAPALGTMATATKRPAGARSC